MWKVIPGDLWDQGTWISTRGQRLVHVEEVCVSSVRLKKQMSCINFMLFPVVCPTIVNGEWDELSCVNQGCHPLRAGPRSSCKHHHIPHPSIQIVARHMWDSHMEEWKQVYGKVLYCEKSSSSKWNKIKPHVPLSCNITSDKL
jgi:hypothetical protein